MSTNKWDAAILLDSFDVASKRKTQGLANATMCGPEGLLETPPPSGFEIIPVVIVKLANVAAGGQDSSLVVPYGMQTDVIARDSQRRALECKIIRTRAAPFCTDGKANVSQSKQKPPR